MKNERDTSGFSRQLRRYYLGYLYIFFILLISLAILEREGVPRAWIGYLFMFVTTILYAGIGLMSRTSEISEYYVAGRRVPAVFNGMATAADWISAASFLSLAGGLYLLGFDGFAYLIGWTGGFCLLAFLIAPYLRRLGQYSVSDFLGTRFAGANGGHAVRVLAVIATVIISFTYVVAQIYGVGLITSRFTGVDFSVGIFLGLASILVCSFLGGMRAVTWTQVAQYLIVFIALLVPVTWLSFKHTGSPIAQTAYGNLLPKLEQSDQRLTLDPKEQEVRAIFLQRAESDAKKIQELPQSWTQERKQLEQKLDELKSGDASLIDIKAAMRALQNYPKTADEARRNWERSQASNLARAALPSSAYMPYAPKAAHLQPQSKTDAQIESDRKRNNFMALVFCLMLGTAALPHLLVRSCTTPSVRASRESVFWSLFFILLVYTMLPALAILVKYDLLNSLVGVEFLKIPSWVNYWVSVDRIAPLINITDINRDGVVQLAEIVLDGDVVVLATPEIAGLPYVISGLVAAGGLAAALSTADGLLLTMANAISHDIYFKIVNPKASTQKRVTISKLILLVLALVAAYVASFKPADILSLVSAAFSIAASTLFPALVLGVFWRRANATGAVVGICGGFAVCVYYMLSCNPQLGGSLANQWWHIAPISAGLFGVPAGFASMIVASYLSKAPDAATDKLVALLRSAE
jgi:cation/acetate symporter